jgi:hypothetical protein
VSAPPALSVAELPAQIEVGELLAVTVGLGLTVIEIVLVFVQAPFAPTTV